MKSVSKHLAAVLAGLTLPFGLAAAGTYNPDGIDLELEPGQVTYLSYTYSDPSANSVCPLIGYEGDASLGAWITGSSSCAYGSSTASVVIRVSVPIDAQDGVYEGRFMSRSWTYGKGWTQSDSLPLVVSLGAAACSEPAGFDTSSENQISLWAPNHSEHEVELSGGLSIPEGCEVLSAKYVVTDEYGKYNSEGEIEISGDGTAYSALPVIEVSRRGKDLDGREYTVTLLIETEAGVTSHTRTIVVPHDKGKKSGKAK